MSDLALAQSIRSPQPVGKIRLVFYAAVHLLFCNLYFGLLLWLNWPLVLLAVAALTSGWASRDSRTYRQYGFPYGPLTVGILCLVGWPLTFPTYLTWRQWLKLRYSLKHH